MTEEEHADLLDFIKRTCPIPKTQNYFLITKNKKVFWGHIKSKNFFYEHWSNATIRIEKGDILVANP